MPRLVGAQQRGRASIRLEEPFMNRNRGKWLGIGIAIVIGTGMLAGPALAAGLRATPVRSQTPIFRSDVLMGASDPNAPFDLRFIDEMISHHEGAIMCSEGMIADSTHPELRDLAGRIMSGQQRQ